MDYQHTVLKYFPPKKGDQHGTFKEHLSRSTEYYSMGYTFAGGTEEKQIEVDTLSDLWRIFTNERDADCEIGAEKMWHYRFYRHNIVEENGELIDYITPLAIFKRGNDIFVNPISV